MCEFIALLKASPMFESLENDRIEIRDGACFRGTEISVDSVLTKLRSSDSMEAVLAEFPTLSREDIAAAREFEKTSGRLWAAHWAKTGPILEQVRKRELEEMTTEEHQRAIRAVLEIVPVDKNPRQTSGLVEFQRLMRGTK